MLFGDDLHQGNSYGNDRGGYANDYGSQNFRRDRIGSPSGSRVGSPSPSFHNDYDRRDPYHGSRAPSFRENHDRHSPYQHQGPFGRGGMTDYFGAKELFMHVMIQNVEEDPLQSISNWLGGMVRGSRHKDERLMEDNMKNILFASEKTMAMHGWRCFAQPVMMPPVPGQAQWTNYLQVGRAGPPTLVVLRLHLTSRVRNRDEVLCDICTGCWDSCVPPKPPQTSQERYEIAQTMMSELRRLHKTITAQVDVMDANRLYQEFLKRGWSESLSMQAVQHARDAGQSHHETYGSSYDNGLHHDQYSGGHGYSGNRDHYGGGQIGGGQIGGFGGGYGGGYGDHRY